MKSINKTDTGLAREDIKHFLARLLMLVAPIIVSQFAQMASGVIDVIMAGHLGVKVLGAVSVGATMWTSMMIFLVGLLYVMVPTIGKLRGEKRDEMILGVVSRGMIIGISSSIILGSILYFLSGPLFRMIGVAPELVDTAEEYVRFTAYGLPGIAIFLVLRFTVEARNAPFLVTIAIICGIFLKVIANLAFVFGYFGVEKIGVAGFGLSTVIVFWGTALILLVLSLRHVQEISKGIVSAADVRISELWKTLKGGLPIALNFLSEYVVMTVISLFIATISAVAISSHQIAFNFLMVLVMFPTGLSMAATILVSHALGAGNKTGGAIVIGLCLFFSALVAIIFACLSLTFLPEIVRLYTPDISVFEEAIVLFKIVALILLIDVLVIALGFLLRGMNDAAGPFYILLAAHWLISIPLGYVLCFTDWIVMPLGVVGWWYALSAGLIMALLLMTLRMRKIFLRI